MRAVGDEHRVDLIGQRQRALDDVVVPVHLHRAAVPEVREHAQARVDRRIELVERRVRVPGGDADALLGEDSASSPCRDRSPARA